MRGGRGGEGGRKCGGGKNEEDVRERRREAVKKQRGGMKERLHGGGGWVQAICERSHLHLSVHLSKDGHASAEMDGEVSVNECDNYHAVSPCLNRSRVTHLSVTICNGVCV